MAKPIAFGNYQFRTKKSATEEARRRINQYEAGNKLSIDDELFFTSLFTLHSNYKEKKGVGIDHVRVEKDFHNNRCLYIYRIDGSNIDCSWVHCIQPASQKTTVSMAFRRAVKGRIMEFKKLKLRGNSVCPELGIPLFFENSHASYLERSFEQILDSFLSQNQITHESVKLTNPQPSDSDQRGILSDIDQTKNWSEYHQQNTTLQLISAEANLRKTKNIN
jgi:hypothetical protein